LHLWLFFATGSIHQEAQAVNFNFICTSGFTGHEILDNMRWIEYDMERALSDLIKRYWVAYETMVHKIRIENDMTREIFLRILQKIRSNTITEVSLKNCLFTQDGRAISLAKALEDNTSVKTLVISLTDIGSHDTVVIV
jgi:hypothetical protein